MYVYNSYNLNNNCHHLLQQQQENILLNATTTNKKVGYFQYKHLPTSNKNVASTYQTTLLTTHNTIFKRLSLPFKHITYIHTPILISQHL